MNSQKAKIYLNKVAEDALAGRLWNATKTGISAGIKAAKEDFKQSKTLEQHDKQFHPNGFDEKKDHCKFRENLAKKDEADEKVNLSKGEANKEASSIYWEHDLYDLLKKYGVSGDEIEMEMLDMPQTAEDLGNLLSKYGVSDANVQKELSDFPTKKTSAYPIAGIGILKFDITKFDGDAIIDAGNRWMIVGGGVDGAVHKAAGDSLLKQCNDLPADQNGFKINTGDAKLLDGGNLPASKVIYTVGPDVRQFAVIPPGTPKDRFGNPDTKADWNTVSESDKNKCINLLRMAYRNSFDIAAKNGLRSIATPSISTGIFSFPKEIAAQIFADEARRFINGGPDRYVQMCLGGKDMDSVARAVNLFSQKF